MTYFDRIKKANPYHDSAGRFATQNGAASVSIGPAHAKTIARLKAQLGAKEKDASERKYSDYSQLKHNEYRQTVIRLYKSSEDEYNKLSFSEKESIRQYTGDSSKYYNELAGTPVSEEKRNSTQEYAYEIMHTLDTALSKTTAPENMIVYKAMNLGRLLVENIDKKTSLSELEKLVGKEFVDKSYGSSSASFSTALQFSTPSRVIVRIKVPQGSKAAWLGSVDGPKRSSVLDEGELLLPRNRAYRITKVSKLTSWQSQYAPHVVELELLNPTTNPTPLN